MAIPPRRLQPDEILYRAITPEDYVDEDVLRSGFEDTGKLRDGTISTTLSFSAKSEATAVRVFELMSLRKAVRVKCGTGNIRPTPEQMYEAGYRVVAIMADVVLTACAVENTPVRIVEKDSSQIEEGGHVQIEQGDKLADTWASQCKILSERNTFSL